MTVAAISILSRRFMDEGKFVPDKIIFEVLVAAVERVRGGGKHVMLDGFPRWGAFFSFVSFDFVALSSVILTLLT